MTRSGAKALRCLLGLALLAWATLCLAAHVEVFRSAEFRWMGGYAGDPSATARWEPVALPHAWYQTVPGSAGFGWYRIRFDVDRVPYTAQGLELDAWRSDWVDFYVNGTLIGGSRDVTTGRSLGLNTSVFLTFPGTLLHAGHNTLLAHMHTSHGKMNIQGLGRVTFGDARPVRQRAIEAQEWGFYAERSFFAMAFAAGLISFFVWLARRSDNVLLWYCVACLSWVAAGALWNVLRWSDLMPQLQTVLLSYRVYGLAVPALVLALRVAGQRLPAFEACLWFFLAWEVLSPLHASAQNLMPSSETYPSSDCTRCSSGSSADRARGYRPMISAASARSRASASSPTGRCSISAPNRM